jgi:hypothetical protein
VKAGDANRSCLSFVSMLRPCRDDMSCLVANRNVCLCLIWSIG